MQISEITHTPLVSIIIITYNSSKYVLETLESAKNQTYTNIELIISDDCSTDNTLGICKSWIHKNKDSFVHTNFISARRNTGITSNCNRGLNVSNGEWIKFIAGDDVLLPDCISNFVDFVFENNNSNIIYSKIHFQDDVNKNSKNYYQKKVKLLTPKLIKFGNKSSKKQLKSLLRSQSNFIPAPSLFIKKSFLDEYNGFDERFKMLEDFPFIIKVLLNKEKLLFLDKETVRYRIESGISQGNQISINPIFFKCLHKYYESVIFPLLIKYKYYLVYYDQKSYYYINQQMLSKGSTYNDLPLKLKFFRIISPLKILRIVEERIINKIFYKF